MIRIHLLMIVMLNLRMANYLLEQQRLTFKKENFHACNLSNESVRSQTH